MVSVRGEEGALAFEIDVNGDLGSERRAQHDRVEALGGQATITAGSGGTTVAGSCRSRDDASRPPRGRGSRP